jgi:hypothetical protein
MGRSKYPTSYRLSDECLGLIEQLAGTLGISQAGVIEQAVRKLARAELPASTSESASGVKKESKSTRTAAEDLSGAVEKKGKTRKP